jgi:hypothetical protein
MDYAIINVICSVYKILIMGSIVWIVVLQDFHHVSIISQILYGVIKLSIIFIYNKVYNIGILFTKVIVGPVEVG